MLFGKMRECGINLPPARYALLMKKMKYVGHVVSKNGIEPDDDKIRKLKEWP